MSAVFLSIEYLSVSFGIHMYEIIKIEIYFIRFSFFKKIRIICNAEWQLFSNRNISNNEGTKTYHKFPSDGSYCTNESRW